MDRHLLDAFIDSFTDTLADKLAQRLAGPLRPPVKAVERPVERPTPVPLVPAAPPANDATAAPRPPSDSDLLDTIEAAEILGVSPGTLENWRGEGKGPKFRRVGRLIRYRRGDLTG